MLVERCIPLSSHDAVAVSDRGEVLLCFSERLSALQRAVLRPHLIAGLDLTEPVAALAVPRDAAAMMIAKDFHLAPADPDDLVVDVPRQRDLRQGHPHGPSRGDATVSPLTWPDATGRQVGGR